MKALIILIVIVIATSSFATIINIPTDYPTIQQGIDVSSDGDTVLVQPGTYYENINFNGHNIVLGSLFLTTGDTSYIEQTVIDGDSLSSVATFENGEDSTAAIVGFVIQNSYVAYNQEGAGVYCANCSSPMIANNIILHNFGFYGGGIMCTNYAGPFIIDNKIIDNEAVWRGGGILCANNADCLIQDNIISGNVVSTGCDDASTLGGGICCIEYSNPSIANNLIYNNIVGIAGFRSSAYGGGIYCRESNPQIINNTISGNESWANGYYSHGGGIYTNNAIPQVINTIIWANFPREIEGTQPTVSYSNINGGAVGEGNIDANPLYIDAYNGSFNVCTQSPCIDAGDPSINDPDGSRSDIGKYYTDHPDCFLGNKLFVSTEGDDVNGNGSEESPFRSIQNGINRAVHGDTIVVSEGTYVENPIVYLKDVFIVSKYYHTGNTDFIQNTIIDGSFSSNVFDFSFTDTLVGICGFIIRNGHLDYFEGGGGLRCIESSPLICSDIFIDNVARHGAAIALYDNSNATIKNCTFSRNTSIYGEGIIYSLDSSPYIVNSICWNSGDEIIYDGGDPTIRYCDVRNGLQGEGNINTDPLFISPQTGNYNIRTNSPCIDSGDPQLLDPDGTRSDIGVYFTDHPESDTSAIWFVSTQGSDTVGNGSYENPFRTIQHAVDVAYHGDTIIVENGTYAENVSISENIILASNFLYSNNQYDITNTIIDGNYDGSVITFNNCDTLTSIIGFTLTNGNGFNGGGVCCAYASYPKIKNNIIFNNYARNYGGGIYLYGSSPKIIKNHLINNKSLYHGGGISCEFSNPAILGNIIMYDSTESPSANGGGIDIFHCSDISLINNTVSQNFSSRGGGINNFSTNLYLVNGIIYNNHGDVGEQLWHGGQGGIFASYSDIQGGWPGEGNIDVDPLFRDPENGDFHLMAIECGDPYDSPCIDAGMPSILDSLLDCDWGLGSERSDIGAYGGGAGGVDIDEPVIMIPTKISLSQNYPNPFNASTIIKYELPKQSQVTIEIYDILGRRVTTLQDGLQAAGYYQAVWRAEDVASGVYFYKLQAGEYVESKKMILVK